MVTKPAFIGGNYMKILSEMPTGMGGKWVLVKYENDYYAYGTEDCIHCFLGFPVNQFGTKEEVLAHCESIAELCRQNIERYNKKKDNHNGWKILIEDEQKELEMLTEFARILSN